MATPARLLAPLREFYPRLLAPGDLPAAVSAVAQSSGIPRAALAAAVSSAASWTPRPLRHDPARGAHPVPHPIATAALAALASPRGPRHLLDLLDDGADTMYAGPRLRVYCDNHPSAYLNACIVDEHVAAHLRSGWMIDVTDIYTAAPLLPIISAPIAVVPKPNKPGKYRLIFDASARPALCVNDFVDPSALGFPMLATCESVRASILTARLRCPGETVLLSVADFSDAYKKIPLRVDDWWQMAQLWRGRVYWNIAEPFGLRSADRQLAILTSAISASVARASGLTPEVYVDDSLLAGSADELPRATTALEHFSSSVGLTFNPSVSRDPRPTATFIGWQWDTVAMTQSLPPTKLARLRATILAVSSARRVRRKALESLLGAMHNASGGIRHASAFLAECCSLLRGSVRNHWVTLTPLARLDLAFWVDLIHTFNGVTLFRPPAVSLSLFSDASNTGWDGHGGYGWYCPELRSFGRGAWPAELAGVHINVLESLGELLALSALASICPPSSAVSVHSHLDNTVAVSVFDSRRGAAGPLARIARALAFLCATSPHLHPSTTTHLQGLLNTVADALSRNRTPPEVSGFTEVFTPPAWLISTLASERPWRDLALPFPTVPASGRSAATAPATASPPVPPPSTPPTASSVASYSTSWSATSDTRRCATTSAPCATPGGAASQATHLSSPQPCGGPSF